MVLMAVDEFFRQLGLTEIRRRSTSDDKPLRMVKTLLHELCKKKVGWPNRRIGISRVHTMKPHAAQCTHQAVCRSSAGSSTERLCSHLEAESRN
jgi:hypothetical protein